MDHRDACSRGGRVGKGLATDSVTAAPMLEECGRISWQRAGFAEPDFLHRDDLGHGGFLAQEWTQSIARVLLQHGGSSVHCVFAADTTDARFGELDCAGRPSSLLSNGNLLGRAVATWRKAG